MRASKYHGVYIFLQLLMPMINHMISAQAIATYTVRLVNTLSPASNPMEGRLEIYYSGTWGTVCDDGFANASARVACASLGYGYIGAFIGNRHGAGTGKIWLDDVTCTGGEYGLEKCQHGVWDSHDCNHGEDVSISCGTSGTFAIRLINALSSVNNPNEGRLEIFYSGAWGTVCDDGFTNISATVACNSLGYGYIGTVIINRHGSGTGSIWLDDNTCAGTEQSIDRCPHRGWGVTDCTHAEDVAISCGATPRLVNSLSSVTYPNEGRLEIYYAGQWGTVCDDSFSNISARVACQSLGFGYVGTVIVNRHGSGTGSIWLDDNTCAGTEQRIDRCPHRGWGVSDCTHTEDVAISCGATPRLVNSLSSVTNPQEGRLEIYYAGEWGTVCDDSFANASAAVACRNLGFGSIGTFVANRHGNGTGRIWLDDILCTGSELSIDRCAHNPWGTNDCSHSEDVSVKCGNTPDYAVRLVNTESGVSKPMEGRLEIYYSGIWGTVCDDSFTNTSARVACASLGFGYIGRFTGNRHTIATGQIWLDDVICLGNESGIESCLHTSWGTHNCGHSEDVSIICELSVRLINSVAGDVNPMEGQLEVYYSGAWGTVCDDKFTDTAAGVACASLGFGYTGKFIGNRYGTGLGQIWLDDVICNGTERSIAQCEHRTWGLHDCTRGELVSIKCDDTEEYAVRLINSQNPGRNAMEGRLEIYFAGVWGSVCDDGFTNITAKVVCASLGYGYEGTFTSSSQYGAGTGKIWLDDVICTGREPGIDKCKHLSWGLHNCNHREDVGIKCGIVRNFAMRLVNTHSHITNPKEGRLEIYYSGSWGTVCDDNFTDFSATVVCASLGFGRIGKSIGKHHGPGSGQIVLDEVICAGTEQSIDECSHSPWGRHDCTHNKDVSISCGTTTRLVNSLVPAHNPKEGRLEVYYGGVWGTVCSSRAFTETNAKVACANLGFGYNGTVIGNRHGNGTGQIWLDRVSCVGTEQSIDMCSRNSWGSHSCSHNEDVSLRCGETRDFSVRLINVFKNNSKEGRLEIYYSGIWGTVCDDHFTDISAKVACASLGFGYIGGAIGNRHGGGSEAIWLDDVKCNGTESNVESCLHKGWGVHDCGHGEDVSISCGTIVRLANSTGNPKEGRLEIYYAGVWGTVCNDEFNNMNARVACASLGFGHIGVFIGTRYGEGTGQIWLDDVVCTGNETGLEQCSARPWGVHNCGHNEDVSISCVITVRLANSPGDPKEGRLEIYHEGVWGTVCDDNFNNVSARVACASLGFGYVGTFIGSRYGSGIGQIWLDDIICSGNETGLDQCSTRSWGVHDCSHSEDVSISCATLSSETVSTTSTTTQVTLNPTSTVSIGTHTKSTSSFTMPDASYGTDSKSFIALTMSSSVPARASSTPKPPLIMSTLSSSNSKASDSKAHEYTTSPQISMRTSDTSPSSMTSKPTQKRTTSLLLTSESTSTTTSPSRPKSWTTFPVTSTATTVVHVARGSSKKAPIASLESENTSVMSVSTSESSEMKSKSITALFNDATSKNPSDSLTLLPSDLLINSSNSSTGTEHPTNEITATQGYGVIRIIGIVGAIMIGIIFLIIAVVLIRRYKRMTIWSTDESSSGILDLIALKKPEHNSGLLNDECATSFSKKHCNFYHDS